MASENFLSDVKIIDIEDVLSYEEIERERDRLFNLASGMTEAEIRIAGARIADCLKKKDSDLKLRKRALLQLRGQMAMEIYEAMLNNSFQYNRMKRLTTISFSLSTSEQAVYSFTRLRRPGKSFW